MAEKIECPYKGCKWVLLAQNGFRALVDAADYVDLCKYNWYVTDGYAVRSVWTDGRVVHVKMHRQILNAQDGQEVDHANGNGLDNRRSNIRIATHTQNSQNRKKRS